MKKAEIILVPQPRQIQLKQGELAVGSIKQLFYADLFGDAAFSTACYLRDELVERFAHTAAVELVEDFGSKGKVVLGLLSDPKVSRLLPAAARTQAAKELAAEGYVLSISEKGSIIAGVDEAGLFWGVQTFLHMVRRQGQKWAIPCGLVLDGPRYPFRAVHLYVPPRTEIPHLKRLMGYLASIKINTIILELGGSLEFKRHPEINRAFEEFCQIAKENSYGPNPGISLYHPHHGCYGNSVHNEQGGHSWITQDDMRDILRTARRHHLNVIPEIQSLSHSYWLCQAHPEIAERQGEKFPAAYCPSNPRTYELPAGLRG